MNVGRKERAEAERLQKEKEEQERLEIERKALEEQKMKEEYERLEKEHLEAERLRQQKEFQEKVEKAKKAKEEQLKKEEQERLEKERLEAERLKKEKEEKERLEAERLKKEKEEKERIEREKKEREEKELLEREKKEKEEKERLEREKKEKLEQERLEKWNKQDRLIPNNMIFIIPSWGNLLGLPSKGRYVNQEVTKILTDIVIFFAGSECAVETEKGTVYFIFGLGYYYTKFEVQHKSELSKGSYITDSRNLTTLVLSDFVYDQLAKSQKITLEDDRDVIIADDVIKIPTDLSFKTENLQTFIKGAIMRNVFIPNKEIILNFMKEILNPDNFDLGRGHFILSANRDNYNKILVSENLKEFLPSGYTSATAGISEITGGADELISKTLSPLELDKIKASILQLKQIYSTLKFDPIYPYSILENASTVLKSETIPISMREGTKKGVLQKESVLFSAEPNLTKIVGWPQEIERVERVKEVKIIAQPPKEFYAKPEPITSASSAENIAARESILRSYREPLKEEEKFVLRREKSEAVVTKPLPPPPENDIEEILLYVKYVIEENFDMRSFSKACGLARDNLRKIILQADIMWELSKWERLYQTKPANLTFPPKDVKELLEKLDKELKGIQEKKRKEREEKERLEREEKERQEKERERQEFEQRERERQQRIRIEQEKIAKEKQRLAEEQKERQRLESLRKEQEKIQQERERLRIEHERQEQERLDQERLQKEQEAREALEREKEELAKMKEERKAKEKTEKQRSKQDKKLEKQKAKVAKQKEKEQARLDKIK